MRKKITSTILTSLPILFLLTLITQAVTASTIHGTIYSFDLEERNNTVVSVNSVPTQTIVSKDGTYNFELELGKYIISATYSEQGEIKESITENITISKVAWTNEHPRTYKNAAVGSM